MMLYAVWYNITELNLDGFVPVMIYFGYMSLLSLSFSSSQGLLASLHHTTSISLYIVTLKWIRAAA